MKHPFRSRRFTFGAATTAALALMLLGPAAVGSSQAADPNPADCTSGLCMYRDGVKQGVLSTDYPRLQGYQLTGLTAPAGSSGLSPLNLDQGTWHLVNGMAGTAICLYDASRNGVVALGPGEMWQVRGWFKYFYLTPQVPGGPLYKGCPNPIQGELPSTS